jgi:hypothetical protein
MGSPLMSVDQIPNNQTINSYRFPFWLAVIFLCLITVPVSIILGNVTIAKIAGVLTTVLLVFAIRFWFSVAKKRNNKIDRIVLNANDTFELVRYFPFLKTWNKSDLSILKDRIGIILSRYPILGTDQLVADKEVAIKFAAVLVFLGKDMTFSSDVKYIHIIVEGNTVDDKAVATIPITSYQKVSELKVQSFADIQDQYFI